MWRELDSEDKALLDESALSPLLKAESSWLIENEETVSADALEAEFSRFKEALEKQFAPFFEAKEARRIAVEMRWRRRVRSVWRWRRWRGVTRRTATRTT